MNSKKRILGIFIIILFTNCLSTQNHSNKMNFNFQNELDKQIQTEMPGILLSVRTNFKNDYYEWNGASGLSDVKNKIKIIPDQMFRIASVTKTFVAATILRLWEDHKLELDDPISKYLCDEHTEILKKGGYDPDKITIYHLLTHTSGLSDHTNSYKYKWDFLKTNHYWTRTEQLQDLITYTKPTDVIGKRFSYSDTGYILLGEIIEKITHQSLNDAIKEKLKFKKLDLTNIYMEEMDGEFSNKRIHQYIENEDTYFINPTFDYYGGGGLVANTDDLCAFFQYLFENKVFNNSSTLEKMLSSVNFQEKQSLDYRMGIWKIEICGMTAYTHTGFWGTQIVYIPKIKTSIAVNYSQKWKKSSVAPIIPIVVEKIMKNFKLKKVISK